MTSERKTRERERVRARLTYVVSARPRTGDVRNDLSGDEILVFFLSENIVLGAGDFHQDCGIGHHSLQFIET